MKFNHDKFDERVLEAIRSTSGTVSRNVILAKIEREEGDPIFLTVAISKSLGRLRDRGIVVKLSHKDWRLA